MTEARPLCQVCISQIDDQTGDQRQPAAVLELGQVGQQECDVDDEQQRQARRAARGSRFPVRDLIRLKVSGVTMVMAPETARP